MCITGHIYKIIHLDSNICYIGSTCDSISGRWRTHKSTYKNWLNNKEKYDCIAIYPYFEQYSIDRFKMILIKSYDIVGKRHLHVYEQLAINRTKCVNTNASMQLISTNKLAKHYNTLRYVNNRELKLEQAKKYYFDNKDKVKLYREANHDKISDLKKKYHEANRINELERMKNYREQNKVLIKQKASVKITCECGASVRKSSLSTHRKTQKHITSRSD